MGNTVIGEAKENHVGRGAREFPSQVVPDKGSRDAAGDPGRNPVAGSVAPDVPMATLDVALRAIDELVDAIGLVIIKLQRLGHSGGGNVEIHGGFEMGCCIDGGKLL